MSALAGLTERLAGIAGAGAVDAASWGERELPRAAPGSVDQARELLALARQDELVLAPTGLGSKLSWNPVPERVDFLLSTRRLSGIVSHVPDDGTLAARAGTTMVELREAARAGGHFLTPDVCQPVRSTLGGVLAAGHSGADRLRFGPARHHVLGLRVLLGDGTLAKSGGQLVKNVTGFDLHRLYTGSSGTLCLIVEAALRLFPEPDRELWLRREVPDSAELLRLSEGTLRLPLRTVFLGARRGPPWTLAARLFGRREPVDAERAQLEACWGGAQVLEDAAARAEAERERDAAPDLARAPWLRIQMRPSRLAPTLAQVERTLEGHAPCECRVEPGIARIDLTLPERPHELVRELEAALSPTGVELALRRTPTNLALDAAEPVGLGLMGELKRNLDPHGVFASGHLPGGL